MKKNKFLISIVVPVFNVEDYLTECLESLFLDDKEKVELLLIDDGSTDNSHSICKDFAKKFENVQVYKKENGGLSDARNFGILRASGKYIMFVDADDIVKVGAIGVITEVIETFNPDFLKIGYVRFKKKRNIKNNFNGKMVMKKIHSNESLNAILDRKAENYSWSYIFERRIFIENNILFPVNRNYEDMATTCKLLLKSSLGVEICNSLYFYRVRENSISEKKIEKNAYDILKNLKDLGLFLEKDNVNIHSSNFYFYFLLLAYQESNYSRKFLDKIYQFIQDVGFSSLNMKYKLAFIFCKLHVFKCIQLLRSL